MINREWMSLNFSDIELTRKIETACRYYSPSASPTLSSSVAHVDHSTFFNEILGSNSAQFLFVLKLMSYTVAVIFLCWCVYNCWYRDSALEYYNSDNFPYTVIVNQNSDSDSDRDI